MQRLAGWLSRNAQQVNLWNLTAWRTLLTGWQHPHLQHDSAEFLMHMEHVLHPDFQMGHWQARLSSMSQPSQVTDHGKMWPVTLPAILRHTSDGSHSVHSVQSLIIGWRNQVQRHAAVSFPPVVPFQLGRFDNAGNKLLGRIVPTPVVHVPLFAGADLTTTSHKYMLQAVIYHLGATRHSGHYRTMLCLAGHPYATTDDNLFPVRVTAEDMEVIMNNSYIAFYCIQERG